MCREFLKVHSSLTVHFKESDFHYNKPKQGFYLQWSGYCEDIFVAAARKEFEYTIKHTTYSNLVYSPYEPLYSFNTLVLLLNGIFIKNMFRRSGPLQSIGQTDEDQSVETCIYKNAVKQ